MSYFLGVDAGTTSLKAALFDSLGSLVAIERQEYSLEFPMPGIVELDPGIYWDACRQVIRQVISEARIHPEEAISLCISSQGETLIPVDEKGRPTYRAIVWLDNRAQEEAIIIADQFGVETIYQHCGQPEVTPGWPASKLLWLRRNEPAIFSRSSKFFLLEDYLLFRMTGEYVTESALQTSSLLLDIHKQIWWQEMLDFLNLTPERLGRLVFPGEIVGHLSSQVAEDLGLSMHTQVVSGGMDQVVGAIGAGNISPGMVSEMTGGALAVLITLQEPFIDPQRRIPCQVHAAPRRYCLLPYSQTGGMALRWFRDQFFSLEAKQAEQQGFDAYDRMTSLAGSVPPGCEGLLMLPHLEGAYCPEFNPSARAVFFGATLHHSRAHFIRAILEAIAFMLKRDIDLVEGLGFPVEEIRSLGGGARSPLWLQIKADVLEKPVIIVNVEEAACLGAAILGAVATRHYATLEDAVHQMVQVRQRFHPNPANYDVYRQCFANYEELYERLATLFCKSSS